MAAQCDIAIVGGGMVGGCLALALESTGLSVTVIEAMTAKQKASAPAGERAIALAKGSKQILERLGLWQDGAVHATPIKNIHISDQGHFGKARLSAMEEGVDALGYVVKAKHIEKKITEALADSTITVLSPARVVDLETGSDRVNLKLSLGEKNQNLSTRLIVGSDGSNSGIRRLLGIGETARDYGQTAIVSEVKTEKNPRYWAYERFTAMGPLAFLPIENRCCSVIWTLDQDQVQRIVQFPDKDFTRELQANFGYRLGRLSLRGKRVAFPLKLIRAKQAIGERAVLIGNAVNQLHPVAGQGLNLGLRDAALLAESLAEVTGENSDPGAREQLTAYDKSRQSDHDAVVGFTDRVVRIFSNDFLPLAFVRNIGLLGLDHIPVAKHMLADHAMGLAGRMPRLTHRRAS